MSDAILTALPVTPKSADVVPTSAIISIAPRRSWLRTIWDGCGSLAEWLFGAAAIAFGLALLAAVPLLQFMSLGYLLEAGARVARTGRLRDGFIGIRHAARLGSVALGTWLMLLPLRYVASVARAAQLIDPDGAAAHNWQTGLTVLTVVMALHIFTACSRGGRLRYFLWPFGNPIWLMRRLGRGGCYAEARDAVWDFVMALRLPYYFWLGARGFVGTMLWLIVPVTLIAVGRQAPLVGFIGAFVLAVIVLHLPFLQMRFATANRFGALFEWRSVRRGFRQAPWAYTLACFVMLAFALPLYLLKIEMVPRDIAWLPSLVFVSFVFPARLLAGWAYGRSERRDTPRHWFFRWTGRLWLVPTAAFYVGFVYLAQFTSWEGLGSLYEQHAFLLPVPFMGM